MKACFGFIPSSLLPYLHTLEGHNVHLAILPMDLTVKRVSSEHPMLLFCCNLADECKSCIGLPEFLQNRNNVCTSYCEPSEIEHIGV